MAEAAAARRAPFGALWEPAPGRAELALRLALICALTTLVTEYYGTPEPALTAYLVFFLNKPDRTSSVILNIAFIVLITLVIALVFGLAILVIDAPAWRVAAMTLSSVLLLFLTSASKLRPVGAILALIVAYALDLLGFTPSAELATRGLLYAWLFVGIPAGLSLAVNLLLAPTPRRLAERAIAARLRAAAAALAEPGRADAFDRLREEGIGEVLQHLHLAHVEHTLRPADLRHLQAAAQSTAELLFLVDAIRHTPAVTAPWRDEAAATLGRMASAFEAGGYPVGIDPVAAEPAPVDVLVDDFHAVLRRYADAADEAAAQAGTPKAGFFLPDAFSNPEHLHYALKTTAAAMACYFLYVLLDWPGIHTCLITCYIVALPTTGETVEKLSLRIVGCLAGAAVGTAAIVWVVPALETVWALLAVVSAGALAGGWIAAGSPRIAYAGFQFAFAFFLCVIQGTGPDFDLTIARDRVIGILLGNAMTWLVFTQAWPVSVAARIERTLATTLTGFGGLARLSRAARRARAPALHAGLATLRTDLALLPYEPPSLRPPADWAATRQAAVGALAALEGPLLLDGEARFWHPAADRLEGLAQRLQGAPTRLPDEGPAAVTRMQDRARTQLRILEDALDERR